MIEIEIDGQKIEIEQGSMIIEAADRANLNIPRFCYHKKLTVAANCRMCLVEVEKVGKPVPACATPVTDGMKIKTLSKKAKEAQKGVMEFLLINHPLDCPICDQGGECELQDVAISYGKDVSRFTEGKRAVQDKELGPLIASNMTRCIHCTRCVRFGQEIAGVRELGATGRGEQMEIGTYVEHAMQSELSGNIIDVCPVGALTSKPYAFKARAWELKQIAGIAAHDGIGSHLYVHSRRNEVMRVIPKDHNDLNEVWLSDRDRFSYLGLGSDERLNFPLVKQNGLWRKNDWHTALNEIATRLQSIVANFGADQIGGIISPNATLEEHYLFQKVLRSLGCNNVDHRLREQDTSDQHLLPLAPTLDVSLPELREQDVIFLIGSNIRHEQPLLGIRLLKATLRVGARILCLNPQDYEFQFPVFQKTICSMDAMPQHLAAIVKILAEKRQFKLDKSIIKTLETVNPTDLDRDMAQQLMAGGEKGVVLLGAQALQHPQAGTLRQLANIIGQILPVKVAHLNTGANAAGGWIAGTLPHRSAAGQPVDTAGLTVAEQWTQPRKAYLLFGVEPELDCINSGTALKALRNAEYVVSFTSFITETMRSYADSLLPIATFSECAGTYINFNGDWQSFTTAVETKDDIKQGWKVLRVLGNLLNLEGFNYQQSEQIRDELDMQVSQHNLVTDSSSITLDLSKVSKKLNRLTEWPIYKIDALVRRANALQESPLGRYPVFALHPADAARFHLTEGNWVKVKQGEVTLELPLTISKHIAEGQAFIPAGVPETIDFPFTSGPINILSERDDD